MEWSLLQNVEEESVDFLKTIKNLLDWVVTVKIGCMVPSYSMLPEQVVGEHCPILHHSSSQTEHHVQTLVLESPVTAEGCWETCSCAVFLWPGLLCCGSDGCGAHCKAALLTITSVFLVLCAQIQHWSQMAKFSCVPPEFKLYPQAVLCIYWSSLEWNGKYTYFKSILFGILILF